MAERSRRSSGTQSSACSARPRSTRTTRCERFERQRGCYAVTVVGPAGIGKSRLARELIAEIGDDATVVVGRCPSYGEGVTYRPLAEIVGQLGGGNPQPRGTELLHRDEAVA